MSDFHCSPSANITSVSGMDGNSSNSFRILRYPLYFSIGNDFCAYFAGVCI